MHSGGGGGGDDDQDDEKLPPPLQTVTSHGERRHTFAGVVGEKSSGSLSATSFRSVVKGTMYLKGIKDLDVKANGTTYVVRSLLSLFSLSLSVCPLN